MNRCRDDLKRRERARADNSVSEDLGGMVRTIGFDVGYDHRAFPDDCGGGGHGVSGMKLNFILRGPGGAVVWAAYLPNWYPGNVAEFMGDIPAAEGLQSLVPCRRDSDGIAYDLGYHSPKPQYDDHTRQDLCHLLPEGYCYYDGSSLNAQPILEAFLEHGPHAVWASLARYYQEVFHE